MTNQSPSTQLSQQGSAMIYIFMAIAAFAALSFAVANIMRSGNADPNREVMQLQSTDVVQYADSLKRAVHGMQIRGVEDSRISFESPVLSGYAPHASCSSDDCRVFQAAGGGGSYIPPPSDWLDSAGAGDPLYGRWFFPAGVCVQDVGSGGAGCESDGLDNEELVAILPWVRRDLCIQLNERLGILNPAGSPPNATAAAWSAGNTRFTGTFSEEAIIARPGAMAGCLRGAGTPPTNSYFYYRVLLAR